MPLKFRVTAGACHARRPGAGRRGLSRGFRHLLLDHKFDRLEGPASGQMSGLIRLPSGDDPSKFQRVSATTTDVGRSRPFGPAPPAMAGLCASAPQLALGNPVGSTVFLVAPQVMRSALQPTTVHAISYAIP